MSFTSWPFALFVALIFLLYYAPWLRRWRVWLLVAGSIFFYAWDQWRLLPLLLATVLGTHACLILAMRGSRAWMWAGIAFNLSVLAFFKYKFLILSPSTHLGDGWLDVLLRLPLPIGISFFVFHNISLLVDFTRPDSTLPKPKLSEVFFYIIFFPQLVSGPITRARSFFPQIGEKLFRDVDWASAARWIIAGYFMKLFCANNLSQFTSYMDPKLNGTLSSLDRAFFLLLYSFQIYADFFGYSAIAIGLALLFGYRLPVNFRRPYLARSFADFWSRWHISLSTWLKNYLYVPLGGNRHGHARTYANLLIVMGLGGLWHGAGLGYLLWGLVHGALLAIERPFLDAEQRFQNRAPKWLARIASWGRIAFVFAVVSWAWLFFKLPRFDDATAYLHGMFTHAPRPGFAASFYVLALLYSAPVIVQHVCGWMAQREWFRRIEPAFLGLLIFVAIVECGPETAFIYFQF
ncbi:MAG: MBOAT family O-acyltransferase [Chthoniobacteraceae bacterium]